MVIKGEKHINKNDKIVMLWCFLNRHINFKMGVFSGLVAGSIVFVINMGHGMGPAFASFGKQFGFNLIMAGFNTRSCEKIAKNIPSTLLSIVMACLIPTFQAFLILYGVHYFGATPKPMASTIWQVPFNLGIFLFFALIYRDIIHLQNQKINQVSKVFRLRLLMPVKRINTIVKNRKNAS